MLITKAVTAYKDLKSVPKVAKFLRVSTHKTIKLLVTGGIYPTLRSQQVARMREAGMPEKDICDRLGCSRKYLDRYTPYGRVIYRDCPSTNAEHIRDWRRKKQASK